MNTAIRTTVATKANAPDPGTRTRSNTARVRRVPRKRYAWLGAVAALALFAQCRSPVGLPSLSTAAAPIAQQPDFTVLTFNVNFGIPQDPENLRAILDANADIVMLQETDGLSEQFLGDGLRAIYPHQIWASPEAPLAAGGSAILSRFPLSNIATSPSVSGWFTALAATVATPEGEVRLMNVHLEPVASLRAALGVSARHRAEIEQHLQTLMVGVSSDTPRIVAGDFNEERAGALRWLHSAGFIDALALFAPNEPTWQWPVGRFTARLQLDHILSDERLEPLRATVLEPTRSDHRPVRAAFRMHR